MKSAFVFVIAWFIAISAQAQAGLAQPETRYRAGYVAVVGRPKPLRSDECNRVVLKSIYLGALN